MATDVSPNSQGLSFCNTHDGTFFFFFFFFSFSSLGHIHGSDTHFQFTALHFKDMGFIKFINQRNSHECCGRMMSLAIGGGTAAAMSTIASERTNS
jgi:hypothetical protein